MPRLPLVSSGLRTSASKCISALAAFALFGLLGCGGGGGTVTAAISVFVVASSSSVNGGATVTVTATVANDSSNAGVTWAAPSLGSLSSTTALAPTYTAPAATSAAQTVTLTATSVADKTKSGSVTITVNPLIIAPVAGNVSFTTGCVGAAGPLVSLSINTTPAQTTTTDSNGNYSFASVPQGTYTITPSLAGSNALFTPKTQSVAVGSGGAVASFQAVVGYAVSGIVSYPTGSATGPVFLTLQPNCPLGGGSFGLGTMINAPGNFTINGAGPGSYIIKAWRDAAQDRWPNASDPTGSSNSFSVSNANVPGVSITLADPAAVAFPATIYAPGVVPFDQGVVLNANPIAKNSSQIPVFWNSICCGNLEVATSYNVQWSTDQNFINNVQSKSFPATGGSQGWVLNQLTNGQQLYFRYQGVLGSTSSSWSSITGPITVGAPAGSVKVSGTATFANVANGPLYIEFSNLAAPYQSYFTEIASPVSPQAYSIQLPAGSYDTTAIIDQNNDNILYDNPDMKPSFSDDLWNIAVSGNSATQNFTLTGGGNSFLGGETTNVQLVDSMGSTKQYYDLLVYSWSGIKQLMNMELVSGPNVVVPQDFYSCGWGTPAFSFCSGFTLDGNPPNVGDAYKFLLTYSDGTSDNTTYTITSLPASFGANPTPAGLGTSLTPTFSWTDPPSAGSYGYTFNAYGWQIPASGWGTFTDSIDSVTWGVDPTGGNDLPQNSGFPSGSTNNWGVSALDSNGDGNGSSLSVGYYPNYTHVVLPDANPTTLGAAKVGQSYSGSIVAANGTAPFTFTVVGLCDGLTSNSSGGTLTISGTPLAAGTVGFQVLVKDNNNYQWGPVTYAINVGQ